MPLKLNPATCQLDMVMGPGSGTATVKFVVDDATVPGTNPAVPTGAGQITINGDVVAAHSIPVETHSRAANEFNIEVQVAATTTGTPGSKAKAGLAQFDDTAFSVDEDGYVTLIGGSAAIDSIGVQNGTNPIFPTAAGLVTINGDTVAAGTNPVRTDGTGANTMAVEVQISQALAATDATKIGLSNFDSAKFTVDANGFVSTAGTGIGQTITGDDMLALSPTLGNWDILGGAGVTTSGAGSTLTIDVTGAGSFTTGSVIFWGASSFAEDNANFFWDDTNNRLGLGITTPLDTFHVVGPMELDFAAVENDNHAIEIVCDANSFSDIKALDIDYITGVLGAGNDEEAILVNIDETASTGGIMIGYLVLTTAEGSATVNGYETGINVNPVVHESGTFGNADNILNIAVDVTAALASGGAGAISAFVADNDTFTIGDAAQFGELEIILTTPASGGGIAPTFEYSTGGAAFSAFGPADGTNGFRNTGAILWDASTLAGWATATSGRYEIRITRTRNVLATSPVLDLVQIAALTEFKWDKNGDVNLNSLTLVTPLAETSGGTGTNTYTTGDILYASAANTLSKLTAGSDTQVLTLAAGVPSWATPTTGTVTSVSGTLNRITSTGGATPVIDIDAAYVGQASITTLGTVTTGTWNATVVDVMYGGTGLSSITDHGIMLGSGTGAVTPLGVASDGQLPIGSTAADPVLATLTAGAGIGIVNAAGSITISSSGAGVTWTVITIDQSAVIGNGYICNKAGLLTLTLPATAVIGDCIRVTGINTAFGWAIAQNAGQRIHLGTSSTTTGVGGSLASTNIRDSVDLICVVSGASTEYNVIASMGNITVV